MKKGQTLIILLVFIVVATTLAGAAVTMNLLNSLGTTKFQEGIVAYSIAESGAENGLLRLLRDPTYTSEVLPVGDGTATIAVTNNGSVITSTGQVQGGSFVRIVQVTVDPSYPVDGNPQWILSWKEIQ